MQAIALILLLLLAGCSEFETKMEEMKSQQVIGWEV